MEQVAEPSLSYRSLESAPEALRSRPLSAQGYRSLLEQYYVTRTSTFANEL
jgi:hypothetical protein